MKKTNADRKLEELRDHYWPRAGDRVWGSPGEKGYFCGPRSLPLLFHLLNEKNITGANCQTVYLELLARLRPAGVVKLVSEREHAFLAGYTGARATRSWKDRMRSLASAGFIEVKETAGQEFGVVLVVHPHLVVLRLKTEGKLPPRWWDAYMDLQRDCGARLPEPEEEAKLKLVDGHEPGSETAGTG